MSDLTYIGVEYIVHIIVGPLSVRPRRGKILDLDLDLLLVVTIGLSSNSV